MIVESDSLAEVCLSCRKPALSIRNPSRSALYSGGLPPGGQLGLPLSRQGAHDVPGECRTACRIFASRLTTTCLAFEVVEFVAKVGAQSPRACHRSHVLLAQDHNAVVLSS